MPYSETLAQKVRQALASTKGLREKKMFGGIAFLVDGTMCIGVDKDDLIVRCEKDQTDELLQKKGRLFFGGGVVAPSARTSPRRSPRRDFVPKEKSSMSSPFVWFHHNGQKSKETKTFLESLFAWKASEGPGGMTMLAVDAGPFAAVGSKEERYGDRDEWIPFVAVDDVEAATKRAVSLGATLVREKSRGPAGEFTVVRDPGGAALALWKKAR